MANGENEIFKRETDMENSSAGLFNTLARLSERVAGIEAKYEERFNAIKEDTTTIRATQHSTNNRMQEFVIAELDCGKNLSKLIAVQENIIKNQETTNFQIEKLTSAVVELNNVRYEVEGAWKASVRLMGVVGATIAGIAALIGGLIWTLGHVSFTVTQ